MPGIAMMTPHAVHYGYAEGVRNTRQGVLDDAFARHPERFVKGLPRAPAVPEAVWINPPSKTEAAEVTVAH